jgi:hypothetical protein
MLLDFGPGFDNFKSCLDYLINSVAIVNNTLSNGGHARLYANVVDAIRPQDFQNQTQQVLVTTNWISPSSLDSKYYEQLPSSWYGVYAGKVDIIDHTPTKSFNCFINRMDPVRQSWLYQFVRRDIFDQGYISFNMDITRHIQLNLCVPDQTPLQVFDQQFEQHFSNIFWAEHKFIRPQVPYRNFEIDNLNLIIMDSKFGIVLETYFDRNEVITFSEKIFRHLKLPRPWIIFSHQHAVKYLRNMGFDVLDDIVDHSYDSIEFDINRQVKLLDIAEQLCKINFTTALVTRLKQAAAHNQQLLSTMLSTWYQDIDHSIDLARKKCLAL